MSSRSPSFWLSAAALTAAAAGAWYYYTSTTTTKDGSSSSSSTSPRKSVGDMDTLIQERFNSCVAHMKDLLSKMPQNSQLEFYALYKQAILGDVDEFMATPPPVYDMVASAKYRAWKSKEGISRTRAMQDYIDKAVHFEFTRTIVNNDDEDFEMEGAAAIEMNGMGIKPSTLAERTKEEEAEEAEDDKAYPLHAAARDNQLSVLEQLLQEGDDKRDPNDVDPSGQTALHLAADAGHPEAIKMLTRYGGDIHAADNDGISVLQAAVISGDFETCRLLCVLGANPDQADLDGDTPRECAKDDPVLKDLLFRASMATLGLDDDHDFQAELQMIGKEATRAESATKSQAPTKEDLGALDNIPIDLEDGDEDMW